MTMTMTMTMKIKTKNKNIKVWEHCLSEAKKDTEWAKNHEFSNAPDKWSACDISINMLKDRLSKSVEEIAEAKYKYLHMRSHLYDSKSRMWIDPFLRDKWENISGEKINP